MSVTLDDLAVPATSTVTCFPCFVLSILYIFLTQTVIDVTHFGITLISRANERLINVCVTMR